MRESSVREYILILLHITHTCFMNIALHIILKVASRMLSIVYVARKDMEWYDFEMGMFQKTLCSPI